MIFRNDKNHLHTLKFSLISSGIFYQSKENYIFITKTDWNFCNRNLQSVAFNRKSWKLLSSFFSTLILLLFKIFFRVIFYLAVAFQRLWFPKAVMWYPHFRESKYKVFSGPYFPVFGLSTERYSVSLRIQSECEKIRTRKNSLFGHFSRSGNKRSNIEMKANSALILKNSFVELFLKLVF